mmetsp:Transcript_81334/g.143519  ORF Transcript_81334/g.143519 Transcript_81334/m.143519 type:complete len:166 (+) Transcript_81334:96-593(+)
MWGLRLMDNNYIPYGNGRDFYFVTNKEFLHGREHHYRDDPVYKDRECKPRQFKVGPKPVGSQRTTQLNKGQWACTGQWADSSKSEKSLPRGSSLPQLPRGHLERGGHEECMQKWLDGRQRDLPMTPTCLRKWHLQACDADVHAPLGIAAPPLYQEGVSKLHIKRH